MDDIQQRWLCALSAPMVALNPRAEYDEPAFYTDPQFIDLQCSWGINDRPQLLSMFKRMTDNGHARHLNGAYQAWRRCLPGEWHALMETLEPRERVLHDFASRTFGDCGPGGILAWDYGRMGFLLRCAVRNQWIDLTESAWLHGRLAVRAQYHYSSWKSYFNGFLFGRGFWGCESKGDDTFAFELDRQGEQSNSVQVARGLAQNMPVFLNNLPWHLELDLPQRPESLEEFDWS
jgi:hypothetical protein